MTTITAGTWRHFPRYMILAMALVVAVNVRFIVLAVATFPGAATSDDFDTSNNYNKVLAAVAEQNALGWSEQASTQNAIPIFDLAGPNHQPLAGAAITATASRPIGNDAPLPVTFHAATPGRYVASQALPAPGQWDLMLRIEADGHSARVTRRVVVK